MEGFNMKKTKQLIALLLTFALLAITPISAMAASGGYVPTAATTYDLNDGKWEESHSLKMSYSKDGKITKRQYIYKDSAPYTINYKWSGNYITKVTYQYSDGTVSTTTRKFKGGLLKSMVNINSEATTKYSYKWKKKKASVKVTTNSTNKVILVSATAKVNSKKQIISSEYKYSDGTKAKVTCKYYSDGKMKEYKSVSSTGTSVEKYNKYGYITMWSYTNTEGKVSLETFKYTMDKKKKAPKELVYTYSYNGETPSTSKTVYTAYKKVSRVRNCDGSNYGFTLG